MEDFSWSITCKSSATTITSVSLWQAVLRLTCRYSSSLALSWLGDKFALSVCTYPAHRLYFTVRLSKDGIMEVVFCHVDNTLI